MWNVPVAYAALTGLLLASLTRISIDPESDRKAVLQAAMAQANVEYGLIQGSKPKRFVETDFAIVPLEQAPLPNAYAVWIQSGNGRHPYTVAFVGQRMFRLGGFTAPELVSLSHTWRIPTPPPDLAALAHALSKLADPHAGKEFIDPSTPDTGVVPSVRSTWNRNAEIMWPRDTIEVLEDRTTLLTFTVFSRAVEEDFADAWDPILYRMSFSGDRKLESWSVRIGKRFSTGAS